MQKLYSQTDPGSCLLKFVDRLPPLGQCPPLVANDPKEELADFYSCRTPVVASTGATTRQCFRLSEKGSAGLVNPFDIDLRAGGSFGGEADTWVLALTAKVIG